MATGKATPRVGNDNYTTISFKIGGVGRNNNKDGWHGATANDGLRRNVGR